MSSGKTKANDWAREVTELVRLAETISGSLKPGIVQLTLSLIESMEIIDPGFPLPEVTRTHTGGLSLIWETQAAKVSLLILTTSAYMLAICTADFQTGLMHIKGPQATDALRSALSYLIEVEIEVDADFFD